MNARIMNNILKLFAKLDDTDFNYVMQKILQFKQEQKRDELNKAAGQLACSEEVDYKRKEAALASESFSKDVASKASEETKVA